MGYIAPINNKSSPTNVAPMASKTWVLKQYLVRSSLFLRSVGKGSYLILLIPCFQDWWRRRWE